MAHASRQSLRYGSLLCKIQKKTLEVGVASAMKAVGADLGVHDVHVGPGESIEVKPGVEADFLSARGVS